jgi:hypothetical protein
MPAKKYKDGSYYWVLRRSHVADNQVLHAPHWEPMLWDAASGTFMTRGEPHGRKPEELASIGKIIPRRENRVTRKGWAPTAINRRTRKAEVVYDVVLNSAKEATKHGSGLPISVEISWAAEDQNIANAFARDLSRRT